MCEILDNRNNPTFNKMRHAYHAFMTKFIGFSFIALLFTSLAAPAFASKTVTSAKVTQGEAVIESKSEYIVDDDDNRDGAWKQKINAGYGVTSFWSTEIEGTYNHNGNDNRGTEFTTLEWKNKIQFTRQDEGWVDSALRVGYIFDLTGDKADKVEIKLIGGKDFGRFIHRANIIFDREVGDNADNALNWGTSWSSRYKYSDAFQAGFEIYDVFGEIGSPEDFKKQDHRIGPVFYGKFQNGLSYDAGYLFGVTDGAPDGTVKAIVKYAF